MESEERVQQIHHSRDSQTSCGDSLEVPACNVMSLRIPRTVRRLQGGSKDETDPGHAAPSLSQPPSPPDADHQQHQQQPAHHQRRPFWKKKSLREKEDGGGSSIPTSSSPLLTHLAAKGLPVGQKPSATDSFAQVLRESLEQPHLSGTTKRKQQQEQQQQQRQHLQGVLWVHESHPSSSPCHPSLSQHWTHATAAPPPTPARLSTEVSPNLSREPSHTMAPTATMPSSHLHMQHPVEDVQDRIQDAEETGERSGDESDDEGSSSSGSSTTASSNDSASFCSCSSSLEQDIDSSLSPFQDWAPNGSLDWKCNGQAPQPPCTPAPMHKQPHFSAADDAKHPDIAGVAGRLAPTGQKSLHHQHHHHHHHHHHSRDEMHPAVEAFLQDSLAFAFSGGGFFFPYSLGCVIQLADMGLITDRTTLAGASCGAIIVACVNAGLDLHGLVPQLLEFAADCRTFGTAGRLRSVIEKFMRRALPPDAHLRCRGTCFLSLTKVFPYLKTCVISDYTSKEDLVQAIATSCHIPAYNDGSFVKEFRGQYFVDGGLIRHIPALPLDHPASYVAGVSCVPFKFLESLPGVQRLRLLRSLSVSPDMFDTFPFAWSEIGGLVLAPAEDPVLLQMVEMGKRDIKQWVASVGLGPYVTGPKYKGIPPATFPPLFCPPPSTQTAQPPSPLSQQHQTLTMPPAAAEHFNSTAWTDSTNLRQQQPPMKPSASPTATAGHKNKGPAGTDSQGLAAAATAPAQLMHLRSSSSSVREGQGHTPTSKSFNKHRTPGMDLPRSSSVQLPVSAATKSDLAAATAAATAAAAAAAAAQLPVNARTPSPGYIRDGPAFVHKSACIKKEAGGATQPSLLPRSSASSCDGACVPNGATSHTGGAPAWSNRSKAATASAAAAKVSWAAAKAPFVRMASMLAMRAGAANAAHVGLSSKVTGKGWGFNCRGKGDIHIPANRGGAETGLGNNDIGTGDRAGGWRGKQKGEIVGNGITTEDDDDVRAGLTQGVNKLQHSGVSNGGSPAGSVASVEGDEYDGEEDLMDMLRWLWGHRSSEDGMEVGSEEGGGREDEEDESTDELDEDGGYEGVAEGWVMDAAMAAAHAAASTLAGLPSAAAAALSSQSKYVRAAAMAAAMATAAAAHSAGLPVAGAAAAAAAAVGIARRQALRDVLQSAGQPPTAALRELLLQVGGSVPAQASLREMLAQVGGSVPSLEALREMLQQARGNVPSREAVREMLHSAYLQYMGGWAGVSPANDSSSSSSHSRTCSGSKWEGIRGESLSSEGSAHMAQGTTQRASCDKGVGGKGAGFVVIGAEDDFGKECKGSDGICDSKQGMGVSRWGRDGSMDERDGGSASAGNKEGLEGFVAAVLAELRRRALKGGAAMRTRWRQPQHAQHAQRVVSAAAADDLRSACDEAAFTANLEPGYSGMDAPQERKEKGYIAVPKDADTQGAPWDEAAFAATLEGPLAARRKREAGGAAREPRRSLCLDPRAAVTQYPQFEECLGSEAQPWQQVQQQRPHQHQWCATFHHERLQQQQAHQHSHQHNNTSYHYHHHHHGRPQTQHSNIPNAQESTGPHIPSAHHTPSPHIHLQHESPRVLDSEQFEQWFDALEGNSDGGDECTAVLDAQTLASICGGS